MIQGLKNEILNDLENQNETVSKITEIVKKEEVWLALQHLRCFITSLTYVMKKLENCHSVDIMTLK